MKLVTAVVKPFAIEDYYGTKVEVQPVMGSVGPVVDLEFKDDPEDFMRFELRDAVRLAEAILEAVEAHAGESLQYLAVGLVGPRNRVSKLVGGFSLFA